MSGMQAAACWPAGIRTTSRSLGELRECRRKQFRRTNWLPSMVCRQNAGHGPRPRFSPRWRWRRSIPRSPTSLFPPSRPDLHVGPADVIWVVNVYQIALVATLLPLAALGEIVGHRRIYLAGLVLFTVASLACACAGSLPSLLMARVLQGLGASGIMSVNTALVRFVYPGRLQGRGFGHNALVVATAFTLGPTIASGILAIGPWSWLFAINIPFGLVAIVIGLKTLPRTPRATHAFDFPGAMLAAGCLGLLILGIGSAAHHAQAGLVLIELAAAVLLGWVLIRRQADHPAPVLPIDLFRRPLFALSTATAVCSFAVQGLAFVSLPFYFEDILGRSQVETGFFMNPLASRGRHDGADRGTPVQSLPPRESLAVSVWHYSAWGWPCWRCFRPARTSPTSFGAWRSADADLAFFRFRT